jgi:hypothetical protein
MNQALYAHMNNKRKMKKKRAVVVNLQIAVELAIDFWKRGNQEFKSMLTNLQPSIKQCQENDLAP